jgi:hypothetical protein
MGFYQRHIVPCLTHLSMSQKQLLPFRQQAVGAAEGRVLEIGIGSGLNLPLYGGMVSSVIGLEPSPELLRMARSRASAAAVPVTLIDASAEVHDPRCIARAGRDAPRAEAGRRAVVRRTWSRAGARRRALAGPARSPVVAHRRRLSSQSQDGRSPQPGRFSHRYAGTSAAARPTDSHVPVPGARKTGVIDRDAFYCPA